MELLKILMILLCINSFLYIGGFRTIEGDLFHGQNALISVTETNDEREFELNGLNETFEETVPYQLESSSAESGGGTASGSAWNLLDALKLVWGFFAFLVNILTTPFALFMSLTGAPAYIHLLLSMPLGIILIIGLIYFARSGK